ncbi:uncharacterized protein LOC121799344 isoform X1 [Salvia splendens]|uniref:uncharacterized protein LOC121799344 isoform X1 n=1 Tax=Salvia splendens TaxID=180675 RepID=UPI001C26D761|nr:uncharacterized protein LOC121799344 isoform X1 [Salvia splendens]XP_042054605.1 uncharacterized protein LOC121799344 isoform X1 [Salvia splendens]XP_042054606.1 uncharacterized protein LOC121799344 isoform X1 [Salvia splendens]
MDYNDNDYEGQNLDLAGEESSKISVLRPFALPKFDFDDSLHGHLRFDSLVENEVFLGIPSQEDNHWIEDFSRGGNGIEFSSSATESCALRRHINVWSEATSSESVEMLLKAVGQEEMVHGEKMVEESDPGDQLGSSTRVAENDSRDAYKVDDVNDGIPSLPPAEVVEFSFSSNQSSGVEINQTECTLQVQETKLSSYAVGIDNKDSSLTVAENLSIAVKRADNNQGETCGLVDESLPHQMQEVLPVHGKEIDNSNSSSMNFDVNAREYVEQDKTSSANFSSSCTAKSTFNPVDEQDIGCNETETRLNGISLEIEHIENQCSRETTSSAQSHKQEHGVDTCIASMLEVSKRHTIDDSSSRDNVCNKVALVVEPAASQHGDVSGPETKQLSESCIMLHERSSIVLPEEGIQDLGIGGNDAATPAFNGGNEMKQDTVIRSSERHKTLVGKEDVSAESNSSPAPSAAYEPTILHDVLDNPSEKDNDHKTDDTVGESGKSIGSIVSRECSEKSVNDGMEDSQNIPAPPKEEEDSVNPPLQGESISPSKKDIVSMQIDAHESAVNGSAPEEESEKLPLDSHEMVLDDVEKEAGSSCPAEAVEVQKPTGSKPDSPIGNDPALHSEVEGKNLAASPVEGDQFAYSREHIPPLSDTEHKDQSRETDSVALKQPSHSDPKEALENNELFPATEIENDTIAASATGEIKTSHQSISLLEISSENIPDEASKELNKLMDDPVNSLVAQNDGIEATPSKEQKIAESERDITDNSSKLSVTSSTVEIDISNKDDVPAPGASCTDLTQIEVNEHASPKKINVENSGNLSNRSQTSGVNEPCKEDETFTFDTRPLESRSTEDADKSMQSFPALQACKMPGEGLPEAAVCSQTDPIVVKETSHVGSSTPGVCPPSGGVGATSERKSRRGGSRSGKGSLKKGNLAKETSALKQTEKGEKSSSFMSPSAAGKLMVFESGVKSRGHVTIPTSSMPDLNTSAPSSSFFQQPFTDLQQVQLRAQIFVYGSLIQGAAPDEACMVSAFGMSDGGRSSWERSWRACVERFHGKKSQGNNTGTPVPSRSVKDVGAKSPDQNNRQGFPQSDVLSSTAARPSIKAIPSPVHSAIPLSSPLWNVSTPSGEALPPGSMSRSALIDYQAVSPLNPYQTPPLRNYVAHSTWPAQAPPAPFPVPWLASSQSSPFEISTSYPAFQSTEPVKLTAVKESPLPITSGLKHGPPIPTTNTGATAVLVAASPLDLKKVKASSGQTCETKTRKRKKSSGSEDVVQVTATAPLSDAVSAHSVPSQISNKAPTVEDLSRVSFIAQNQVGLFPRPVVGSYYSTSVAVSTPSSFAPKGPPSNQAFPVATPSIPSGHLSKGDINMDKRAFSAEGFRKVEEAKLQAQEAAAHAATAITHCDVWSQLELQKSSGLTLDAESKLASAAAAIAAAASVAKAAAAAAKIAADAAVQAKQMADEVLTKSGTSTSTEYNSNSINLVNASPTSISKGGDRNNTPSLMISAAREAARKRIEAASAATRHAENLDSILKAAELAAEAVAHAGKVVAMGDPFSLTALAEAGPSNYWKGPQVVGITGSKSNDLNNGKSISTNAAEVPGVNSQQKELDKDLWGTSHNMSPTERGSSKDTSDRVTLVANIKPHDERTLLDSTKTVLVVRDPDIESRSNISSTSMREGSLVEVLKDRGDSAKAWFSARVLSLKDAEALVCYDTLQSDEGSEQLKEWIMIEAKDGHAPKIRVPHVMTSVQLEGTRKRRRSAVKNYTWSVGDQVDVWLQDCWREGIIAEKNKRDATSFSVHFPAQGETLPVKLWHLRPSLVWSEGEWTEWHKAERDDSQKGDTPAEKRPKLGSTSIEAKGKAKMVKNIDFAEVGGNEELKLPLSSNEKVFTIGSTKEENKLNMARTMRSGLEKEGSKVVFGVPKPGKKRKFMEVSKHYVSDRISKTNVPNDSAKLSKFLMPQGSGSRGFKGTSKEKQVADSKIRPPKSGKPPSVPSRTLVRRDDSTSTRSNARTTSSDRISKESMSNDENESSEQNLAEVDEATEGAMVFSSQAPSQENRKKAVRNTKSERLNQGKLAPASRKIAKDEATEKLISEASEPRRSNRRIQPTSRLLEGLQSSLIISKIPSSSHDKGHRSHTKGRVRGNNNRG